MDDRVSRDKIGILTDTVKALRRRFDIELLKGQEISEEALIERVEKGKYHLILAPLHRYEEWVRLEGAFGISRNSGPTFAGYFCEPTPFFDLPQPSGHLRSIILDLAHLTPSELLTLVGALADEHCRSGLKALLEPNTPVYCENWYGEQGQGNRIDQVLSVYEISQGPWIRRSSAIRIILSALWSLVYEEQSKRAVPSVNSTLPQAPKGYFQMGADSNCLAFRLCYENIPRLTPSEAIQKFWPDKMGSTQAAQLLLKYSDMVRVHPIAETGTLEVVVALFKSAPAEEHPDESRTLWIEPLAQKLIHELPDEIPGPKSPHLRALFPNSQNQPKLSLIATGKIKELQDKLAEQDDLIRELRSGGVGVAPPLPPPDAEALLEAFQQRYFEAKYEIRKFEMQIEDMNQRGASPQQIEILNLKMEALANREKAWIKKLLATVEAHTQSASTLNPKTKIKKS